MAMFVSKIRNLRQTAFALAAVLFVVTSGAAVAREPQVFTGIETGVAVGGYDPVAYFTLKRPVKGDPAITLKHEGVDWRFSSEANRAAFRANPAKFAPQFGGYCSYAVAKGGLASGDPEQWDIVNGKLYLNYNAEVRTTWNGKRPAHIAAGVKNWPKVLGE
jgi:YHS domain-containing protein